METNMDLISVKEIHVGKRIRMDNGDIAELAQSIERHGLINPITVMTLSQGGYQLIAGYRRMEAMKRLGRKDVTATVLSPIDVEEQLRLEIEENERRKEFTIAEKVDYSRRIEEVEKEKARQRMSEHARDGYKRDQGCVTRHTPEKHRAADAVAKRAGFTSESQMRRARYVAEHKPELLERVDAGETTIYEAYTEARGAEKPVFMPNPEFANAPIRPQKNGCVSETKKERERVREIEDSIVAQKAVEVPELKPRFRPEDVEITGDPSVLSCANHERLMSNPVYAALYQAYDEMVGYAYSMRGEMEFRCEAYEKRIRAYEENLRYCRKRIQQLEEGAENDGKKSL